MRSLGLRYRYYLFPHEEHYGPPIFDQWAEGVKYEHQFTRDPNPPSLTFIRSMPMEHAVEEVNSGGVPLAFDFDSSFWVSGLSPVDAAKGVARVDARSLAIPDPGHDVVPEVVPPVSVEQTDPSVEEGQAWVARRGAAPDARNGFMATLTGASGVRLDLLRMRVKTLRPVSGDVTTQAPLRLELLGKWRGPEVLVDGARVSVSRVSATVIAIEIPAGKHAISIS
jgi:hypothetical protein